MTPVLPTPFLDSRAEGHYWLAAALGLASDRAGGRDKISLARDAHHHTLRALDLDPEHPGANHILGRLLVAVGKDDEGFQMLRAVAERRPRHRLDAHYIYEARLFLAEAGVLSAEGPGPESRRER